MKASRILSLLTLLATASALAQGPLTPPPGAPAPVMKSLDQIEARIPLVHGQPGVSVNNVTGTISIDQRGSYYLTKDLTITAAGASGIWIGASAVTLDLNGYAVIHTGNNGNTAIMAAQSAARSIWIKNGCIFGGTSAPATAGWKHGIYGGEDSGINSIRVTDIQVRGAREHGIYISFSPGSVASAGIVDSCMVQNAGKFGIVSRVVSNCSVFSSDTAIYSIDGTVSGCDGHSSSGIGIFAHNGTVTGSRGTSSSSYGILADVVGDSKGKSTSGGGLFGVTVSNSYGDSTSGIGLEATTATNCVGESDSGSFGMKVTGTASFCRGKRPSGVAISAAIAIGCTSGGGTISSAQKHLGTP